MADDHNAVSHLEGLGHNMGDDDNADALGGDALDHLKTAARLLHAKGGKGFIEKHEPATPMDEAVELNGLALAA